MALPRAGRVAILALAPTLAACTGTGAGTSEGSAINGDSSPDASVDVGLSETALGMDTAMQNVGADATLESDATSVADGSGGGAEAADVTMADVADVLTLPTVVSGAVQKGPFVRASSVTVQELDATLAPTGQSFQVTTSDDVGDFTIPLNVSSRYVEVIASGYYFDELTDQLSSGQLTLRALADLGAGGTVDVNLLTSMSEPLVRKLVTGGTPFPQATTQAESAVLSALGYSASSLGTPFTSVGLTGSGTPSGEALAASLIVEQYAVSKGGSEVAQLSQLLGQVGAATADAGGDATLAALHAALCATISAINPASVRSNLTAYYASLGATAAVPPFEQFLCPCGKEWCGSGCVDEKTDPHLWHVR